MTNTLFDISDDITANRHGGNKQSVAANERIKPFKSNLRSQVYACILEAGVPGCTLEEIADSLNKQVHSVSGRVTELKAQKLIRESGRTRKTRSGCEASVLVVV